MKNASLGFFREDGDFALLATLNDNDGLVHATDFNIMVQSLLLMLTSTTGEAIVALERQDAPDYLEVE